MSSKSSEKKRKRNHDSQEPPSKKPALDSQNKPAGTPIRMVKDDNELAPVLGMEYFIFSLLVFLPVRHFLALRLS